MNRNNLLALMVFVSGVALLPEAWGAGRGSHIDRGVENLSGISTSFISEESDDEFEILSEGASELSDATPDLQDALQEAVKKSQWAEVKRLSNLLKKEELETELNQAMDKKDYVTVAELSSQLQALELQSTSQVQADISVQEQRLFSQEMKFLDAQYENFNQKPYGLSVGTTLSLLKSQKEAFSDKSKLGQKPTELWAPVSYTFHEHLKKLSGLEGSYYNGKLFQRPVGYIYFTWADPDKMTPQGQPNPNALFQDLKGIPSIELYYQKLGFFFPPRLAKQILLNSREGQAKLKGHTSLEPQEMAILMNRFLLSDALEPISVYGSTVNDIEGNLKKKYPNQMKLIEGALEKLRDQTKNQDSNEEVRQKVNSRRLVEKISANTGLSDSDAHNVVAFGQGVGEALRGVGRAFRR